MYKKPLLYLILIGTVIRVILASVLELGNDEVYYFTYALHLQLSYFDHPPIIAILIRIFTLNLNVTSELFVRSGSIYCAIIGTLLSYQIGSFLKNTTVGWYAAVLYNTSIYSCIIAGTFILPDSPQIIFWLASLYLGLLIISKSENQVGSRPIHWFLFGLFNGLAIMCKVHGIFIWGGFGLYMIFYDRKMLLSAGFYLALITTLTVISPMLYWNYVNHFITYTYHSSRVGTNHFQVDVDTFFQTFLGQLFYNSPVNVIVSFLGMAVVNKKRLINDSYKRFLFLCGLPMLITVTGISFFNPVLPHWSGPAFLTLSFFGAVYIENVGQKAAHFFPIILRATIIFISLIFICGMIIIKKYPGTIGKSEKARMGEYDFTLDMYGWRDFGNSFKKWYELEVKNGALKPRMKILCNAWFPAAHLDYYVAPLINSHVVSLGELYDIHHYAWLNTYRGGVQKGEDLLCVVPSNYPEDVETNFGKKFHSIQKVITFSQYRSGKICRYFSIYILRSCKEDLSNTKQLIHE